MCGICGLVRTRGSLPGDLDHARAMCAVMTHRGPDADGFRDLGIATVGMRRLRIIDTSEAGDQPIPNEDGSIWVVSNGEIYNFVALRERLERAGHRFRSQADTEVLVHLWEEHGPGLLDHLRGMFAFAVVDTARRKIFLARDRLGIKPLYYVENGGCFAFASELKALVAAGLAARELDLEALDHYLAFGSVPSPLTMLREVRSLPPGHAIEISNGRTRVYRYWELPAEGSTECSEADVAPRVRELLEESIRLQCQSDVPLGAFLSGGIDSSAIASLMPLAAGRAARTFNVTFSGVPSRYDESRHAQLVARETGAEHTEVVVSGVDVRDELERVVWHLDQPSADGVNSYFVSRAASDGGLVVALSGLGGDELFGGYGTYRLVPLLSPGAEAWGRVPNRIRKLAGRGLSRVARARETGGRWHKLGRLADVDSPLSLYATARTLLWPGERRELLAMNLRERARTQPDAEAVLATYSRPEESRWRLVTRLEMRNYMGHRLLRDTDAMSMAHSLEVRVPLIDDGLVEFVAGLNPARLRGSQPKALLVAALKDLLPRSIVERPKQGFEFPMAHWMRHELRDVVEDALSPEAVRTRGLLDPGAVRRLLTRFLDGNQEYQSVWQLVVLELWARAYLDGGGTS